MLSLVVNQSEHDIENFKIDQRYLQETKPINMKCTRKRCGHQWQSTLWQLIEDRFCPRCRQ